MNPYAPKKPTDSPVDTKPGIDAGPIKDLTICYITARKDPQEAWFLDSLERQIKPDDNIRVIIVDLWAKDRTDSNISRVFPVDRYAPKPSPWCGYNKITKTDWWAASSFRNTGLCYCRSDFIAYVDDVSVLSPTWLESARQALTRPDTVTCGAYQKVKNLKVEKGEIKSYEELEAGRDHRIKQMDARQRFKNCLGRWLYGCSLVAPVECLLNVGGWPEFCDGASAEDTSLGIMLHNNGTQVLFDKELMTLESEEDHVYSMKREDKGRIGTEDSKSWAILRRAEGTKYFDNYYEGGMRALREKILAGGSFPIPTEPTVDWYDQQPLSEM